MHETHSLPSSGYNIETVPSMHYTQTPPRAFIGLLLEGRGHLHTLTPGAPDEIIRRRVVRMTPGTTKRGRTISAVAAKHQRASSVI